MVKMQSLFKYFILYFFYLQSLMHFVIFLYLYTFSLYLTGLVEGESSSLCQVEVEVVYPTLQVTDARGSGSMEGLSKLYLWDLFCLDTLKSYFLSEPAPPELIYRVPTRHR